MKKRDPFQGLVTGGELGLQRDKGWISHGDDVPDASPAPDDEEGRTEEEPSGGSRDDD